MRRRARGGLALIAGALLLAAGCNAADPVNATAAGSRLPRTDVTIRSGDATHVFHAELAITPAQQERGLMFRDALAADAGMLFPFSPPRSATFWMRNTLIPLDLVFIGPDRHVLNIAADAQPQSLDLIESGGPVIAVLEIAGGQAAARGIAVGDAVNWSQPSR